MKPAERRWRYNETILHCCRKPGLQSVFCLYSLSCSHHNTDPFTLASTVKQQLQMGFAAPGSGPSAVRFIWTPSAKFKDLNSQIQMEERKTLWESEESAHAYKMRWRLHRVSAAHLFSGLINSLIACQVLTQQYSRPLPSSCPSTPSSSRWGSQTRPQSGHLVCDTHKVMQHSGAPKAF